MYVPTCIVIVTCACFVCSESRGDNPDDVRHVYHDSVVASSSSSSSTELIETEPNLISNLQPCLKLQSCLKLITNAGSVESITLNSAVRPGMPLAVQPRTVNVVQPSFLPLISALRSEVTGFAELPSTTSKASSACIEPTVGSDAMIMQSASASELTGFAELPSTTSKVSSACIELTVGSDAMIMLSATASAESSSIPLHCSETDQTDVGELRQCAYM